MWYFSSRKNFKAFRKEFILAENHFIRRSFDEKLNLTMIINIHIWDAKAIQFRYQEIRNLSFFSLNNWSVCLVFSEVYGAFAKSLSEIQRSKPKYWDILSLSNKPIIPLRIFLKYFPIQINFTKTWLFFVSSANNTFLFESFVLENLLHIRYK